MACCSGLHGCKNGVWLFTDETSMRGNISLLGQAWQVQSEHLVTGGSQVTYWCDWYERLLTDETDMKGNVSLLEQGWQVQCEHLVVEESQVQTGLNANSVFLVPRQMLNPVCSSCSCLRMPC